MKANEEAKVGWLLLRNARASSRRHAKSLAPVMQQTKVLLHLDEERRPPEALPQNLRSQRGRQAAGVAAHLRLMSPSGKDADAALHALQDRQARCALEARAIDHDLRGPVGAMAVALELLNMADDPATRAEVVEVLQRQISRMTTLTQRVHELAQALAD